MCSLQTQQADGGPPACFLFFHNQSCLRPPLPFLSLPAQSFSIGFIPCSLHSPRPKCHASKLENLSLLPLVPSHLLVDTLSHLTLPLLECLSYAPLINSTLFADLLSLPSDKVMIKTYRALRSRARNMMIEHWSSLSLLNYYPFDLRLSLHPFMGLGRFMAERIHQMRSHLLL